MTVQSLSDPWDLFLGQEQFELADFIYRCNQMSSGDIDELLGLWNVLLPDGAEPPFASHHHLHSLIDDIQHGDVKWQSMTATYKSGPQSQDDPTWMMKKWDIWFRDPCELLRNQLANRDFDGETDYAPRQVFNASDKRVYSDFMTGSWVWDEAVCIDFCFELNFMGFDMANRTSSQKIRVPMARCLFQSSLAATR